MKAPARLAALVPLVAALASWRTTALAYGEGFPLDDAWTHMVYGRALATSLAFEYDDGVPGSGATSPLWAMVAAAAHLATGGGSPERAAFALKLAGICAHAAASWLAGRVVRSGGGTWVGGLVAGLVVAAAPRLAMAAVSGMEVSLACALVIGAFVAALERRAVLGGALAGLALLTRPEAIVVAPCVLGLASRAERDRRRLVAAVALTLVPTIAWTVRNRVAFGSWVPMTIAIKAKGLHGWERAGGLVTVFDEMLASSPPLAGHVVTVLAAGALALGLSNRERRPLAAVAAAGFAWAGGLGVTTRFWAPDAFYFQRYVLPAVPLLVVAAVLALEAMLQRAPRGRATAIAAVGVVAVALEIEAWAAVRREYRADVEGVDATQVAVGRWIDEHLAPDAVVWSADAGAIRYFGRRRVLDIGGLNTATAFRDPLAIAPDWAADAAVIVVPFQHSLAMEDGTAPPVVFEAPVDWRTRRRRYGRPMPQQVVAVCPPGEHGRLGMFAALRLQTLGPCRAR